MGLQQMQLFLTIQSSDGAIANVPVGATGLRIEAEPGSIYKLVSTDGTPVRGENITVTRTGRDLSINGLLSTEPVVILDFFLACRFDTNCRLDISSLGADREESITPQTEAQPRQADGSFLMWAANGDHEATAPTPPPEASPVQSETSFNGVFLGVAALGVLGLAAAAGGSDDPAPVASDPTPAPGPVPPPSAPPPSDSDPDPDQGQDPDDPDTDDPPPATKVSIDAIVNDEVSDQAIANGDATNDVTPVIRGQLTDNLDDGEFVQVLRDGQVIDGITFDGVEFDYQDALQDDGEYIYQTVLRNVDGEVISSSDEFVITLDTEVPDAPLISRVEGNNIISEDEAQDGIEVTGSSEAGATVSVNWGDVLLTAESDGNGDWAVVFDEAPFDEGLSTLTAVATDQAGNTSGEQVRAVYLSSENTDTVSSILSAQYIDVSGAP